MVVNIWELIASKRKGKYHCLERLGSREIVRSTSRVIDMVIFDLLTNKILLFIQM